MDPMNNIYTYVDGLEGKMNHTSCLYLNSPPDKTFRKWLEIKWIISAFALWW